jgi:thiol-disulfide isomerase/thioredoxin
MNLTTPRVVALVIAAAVIAVVGVNFVAAVPNEVERERSTLLDEACAPIGPTARNAKLGRMPVIAPDIQALNQSGQMVPLSKYRGRVVLLNFWASWCPPCVEEMPSMDKLQRMFTKDGKSDLVVLAISSDESWKDILEFFKGVGTKLEILWDPAAGGETKDDEKGRVGALSISYGTDKLPESYLIDRDGKIRYYVVNTRDWASPDAQRCIRALLEE